MAYNGAKSAVGLNPKSLTVKKAKLLSLRVMFTIEMAKLVRM